MKKLLIGLVLILSAGVASAQNKLIGVGVSAGVEHRLNENLELGVRYARNRVVITGNSFEDSTRRYEAGLKYTRFFGVLPNLEVSVSLGVKTRVDNTAMYTIEPGVGLAFFLGKGVYLETGITSPVTQTSFTTRTTSFSGNAGLIFSL